MSSSGLSSPRLMKIANNPNKDGRDREILEMGQFAEFTIWGLRMTRTYFLRVANIAQQICDAHNTF